MDLTLDDEQRLLIASARGALARLSPLAHVRTMRSDARGFSPVVWDEMAALGWPGLAVGEAWGGSGRSFLDLVLLLEEMGRVLLPSPFLASAVLVAPLVEALGDEAVQRRWLPALAAGRLTATLALAEPGSPDEWEPITCQARADGAGVVVHGRKTLVPFAPHVGMLFLAACRGDDLVLAIVPPDAPGVACRRLATLGGEPLYEVTCDGVRTADVLAGAAAALARTRLLAATATLAYAMGAAARVLAMTVDYARTRVQFGRPIGAFQAVAHRCADMQSDLDALRYLVYQAAWTLAAGATADAVVGAAKAYGNLALRQLFQHAHQVHGAIGFSTEHDLHLFTRCAKAAELSWGATDRHRAAVARAMGLG